MEGKPAPDEDPPSDKDDTLVLLVSIIGAAAMLAAYTLAAKFGR
jgi:hypothetical protein